MTQKSVLLVTVDCLRSDHVGFMGYPRPTTPFLDSLAAESYVFPAAIVAGAPTYYSLPAVLASRQPLALGRDIIGIAPGEITLPSALKKMGYATAAFSAANPYISAGFGYEQGFDTFCDFLKDGAAPLPEESADIRKNGWAASLNRKIQESRTSVGPLAAVYDEFYFRYCQRITPLPDSLDALRRFPSADVIVDYACSWLGSLGGSPFFLWLHFMDPHSPYYPKAEARGLLGDKAITPYRARYLNSFWNRSDVGTRRLARHCDEVLALYDGGIRWVDVQIARLIEWLRNADRWNDCLLALTADHGEEFLDHGGRYHAPTQLTEELIRVPLLLRVPGAQKKQLADSPFSLLDVAPTLFEAAALPIPSVFRGTSRWPQIERGLRSDSVAITECVSCTNPFHPERRFGPRVLSVREQRFKLVVYFDPAEDYLYDLEADPGEQAPLHASTEKSVRRRLLEQAHEHLRFSVSERDPHSRIRARLRDLRLEWERSYPQRPASSHMYSE